MALLGRSHQVDQAGQGAVWRVDVVFLEKTDWKYEASKASSEGGGRTHTFGLRTPANKLRDKAAYHLSGIAIKAGKPVVSE